MKTTQQTNGVTPTGPLPLDAREASDGERIRPLNFRLIAAILFGVWIVIHVQSGDAPASTTTERQAAPAVAAPQLRNSPQDQQPDTPQRDVYDDSQAQAR